MRLIDYTHCIFVDLCSTLKTLNLTGPIPSQLGRLVNLNNFDLAYNFFDGTIPTELGQLTNAATLYGE